MAVNIVLDNQSFSSPPSNNPNIQGWSFDPPPILNVSYIMGTAIPSPVDIATTIKDYTQSLEEGVYSNIRATVTHVIHPEVEINITGEIAAASAPGYEVLTGNRDVTTTVEFTNLSVLEESSNLITLVFIVSAISSYTGNRENVDFLTFRINLQIIPNTALVVSPEILNYSFLRDGSLPTAQDLTITTGSSWTLTTDKKITVSGTGLTDVSTPEQTIIQGTGTKTVQIGFAPELNDVPGDYFNAEILLSNPDGYTDSAYVNVVIFDTDTFSFDPPTLSFFGVINLLEATPLDFSVFGFGAFTLTAPSWLTLSNSSGTDTGTFTATPINTASIGEGIYQGVITLTEGGDDYELPVTYIVAGTIYSTLDDGNFNFTKDKEYLTIYNVNNGENWELSNVVSLILDITSYNYTSFEEKQFNFPYTAGFFENKTKKHIGEIVERLMPKPNSPEDFGITNLDTFLQTVLPVYRLPKVVASVSIINKIANQAVFENTTQEMVFIAGQKPKSFGVNKGILSHYTIPKRVTVNSKEILNFVVSGNFFTIKRSVNNQAYEDLLTQHSATHNLFRYYFDFSDFAPGDVITIKVVSGADEFTKQYAVLPEEENSYHIGFISQFKTLELFECTGSCTIESDIKGVVEKVYKDLVQHLRRIKTNKTVNLTVNTGFIFKHDEALLDEILRSNKAWLMFNDQQSIEIVPLDKKIVSFDSDRGLYEYELEFEINRENDGDTYSF